MLDDKKTSKINDAKVKWEEEKVKKVLDRFPERKERFINSSDMEIERLYTPADVEKFDYEEELGFPGTYPFTRGVQPTMYRGRHWTMKIGRAHV